jgi:hypothetical protein
VGTSLSGDLCNLLSSARLRSNFIIYEDASDYTQLWAKEVQSDTYDLQFESVKIDILSDVVYIASYVSPYIISFDGTNAFRRFSGYL